MQTEVLASGSQGNSLFIYTKKTKILIDCGISLKKIKARLETLGVCLEDIDAILITHGHSDHVRSLAGISKIVPVYLSEVLFEYLIVKKKLKINSDNVSFFSNKEQLQLGDVVVEVVPVSHDCVDPVGFVLEGDGEKVGVFTDIGVVTDEVKQALSECSKIFLESNHDIPSLVNGERPWFLKNRILKNNGHLSNRHAGRLLSKIHGLNLKEVVLMHLSQDCNHPELAIKTVAEELKNNSIMFSISNIKVAMQDGGLVNCNSFESGLPDHVG